MRRFGMLMAVLLCLGGAVEAGDKAATPFNGKDLTGWKARNPKKNHWVVGTATVNAKNPSQLEVATEGTQLVNAQGGGTDLWSEEKWGDVRIEVEFMVPKGSNSGIYVMGQYEVQVFDSYGRQKLGQSDVGAIYSASAPKMNAAKKPGEWQKFVIDFEAPRYEGGKKTRNAKFVRVELNGQVIQENVEVKGPTPGNIGGGEAATGPIMFQGDHGAVAFRNLRIVARAARESGVGSRE